MCNSNIFELGRPDPIVRTRTSEQEGTFKCWDSIVKLDKGSEREKRGSRPRMTSGDLNQGSGIRNVQMRKVLVTCKRI